MGAHFTRILGAAPFWRDSYSQMYSILEYPTTPLQVCKISLCLYTYLLRLASLSPIAADARQTAALGTCATRYTRAAPFFEWLRALSSRSPSVSSLWTTAHLPLSLSPIDKATSLSNQPTLQWGTPSCAEGDGGRPSSRRRHHASTAFSVPPPLVWKSTNLNCTIIPGRSSEPQHTG